MKRHFTPEEMKAFEPAEKIGLVASISSQGQPHVTLITSMMAARPDQLTLGQFCQGLSKQNIQNNPQIAFLVMTLKKQMWRGRARWTHLRREGPEYERYNDIPMFRYNTYFGINTVHYLDLVEASEGENLPMLPIVASALRTRTAKGGVRTGAGEPILTPFAESMFNNLQALKFLAFIRDDGFPKIIPLIQCQAADSRRLAFAPGPYGEELKQIPVNTEVAVFCLTMQMEDVLTRGIFKGFERVRGLKLGTIDIEWVYNSMPPCHGQIYPEVALKAVVDF
ncbi:MAG TPA: pyridoxamine 5'-phosphate oxidase family protein [Thermodesulfobacteriota bacterium]|nr:pyridoxamine 5'-phosphate oxidase family protein [Thermodesulfobacteriota bacterium]